jgi:O-antigen ligase
LLVGYSILLAAACLYCLAVASVHYTFKSDINHFFYHQLVEPLKQHAVYFSILVFIALLFLIESIKNKDWLYNQIFHLILTFFFSFFLILLSSKLVITFFIIYLLYYFLTFRKFFRLNIYVAGSFMLCTIATISLLFVTKNPVSNRFKEIMTGDLAVVKQNIYQPKDYFNGLQFRLLQWKLVPEILNENKSWWTGVGSGNAKSHLTRKYISKNMYRGNPETSDTGYLKYNTHNQLLESTLQIGIPGAAFFLFICYSLLQLWRRNKNNTARFTILLLLSYSFTESIFETQYGILIFCFFPLFLTQE